VRDGENVEYSWESGRPAHNHSYLAPSLLKALAGRDRRILDLGCGNGSLTARLAGSFDVVGLESSETGIEEARKSYPALDFRSHDVGQPLPGDLRGVFDTVVAAEVIEHLFLPRELFARAREALGGDGEIFVTTPYHGYLKNLALAVTNKYDDHWRPGWDYGHVKFFSPTTLANLAIECGFKIVGFTRVGRIPPLAKTMIMRAAVSDRLN
jgi:2-polyprenyl-3-methyl-5-hydroxy-6-metoxy-1,4-benzoquinol methylase